MSGSGDGSGGLHARGAGAGDGDGEGNADTSDAARLERLGYAQDLLRRMGSFSSFAVSFSIISVLTGCITAYADALGPGGPRALGVGWPLVSAGTMIVALAMAELASAFPTAGALYHWSALLGGPGWGWLTAATNIVGQMAIVAAVDVGLASELAATLGLSSRAALALLAAILASHALLNAFSVRLVAALNDLSATVHILGVVLIVGALFLIGRAQPASFLLEAGTTTRADGNMTLGFLNGLVLSMFTFTGYDASAHLAEETHDAARAAPRGIVVSVAVSAVFGYLLLAGITLGIRDLPRVSRDSHAALLVLREALGPVPGSLAMGAALLAMWFCGLASMTSASRTLYAFARDGGVPGARYVARVSPTRKTPTVAIVCVTVVPFLLVLATVPFSSAIFDAMAKMATMGLYVSYGAPIALGVVARLQGRWKVRGPFHLGPFGIPLAIVAVLYAVVVLFVCSLPPNDLAARLLVGCLAALAVLYFAVVRKRFAGPKVTLAALEAASREGAR